MKKCKVCGALTDTVFNIDFKATPICEECARSIFLQQATWYAKQEFKNLTLPRVMLSLPIILQLYRNAKTMGYKEYSEWVKSRLIGNEV